MKSLYSDIRWAKIQEPREGGKLEEYRFSNTKGSIRYCFIKKNAGEIEGKKYYDIASYRGTGGPLIEYVETGLEEQFMDEFNSNFNEYCENNNIIAEFAKIDPWSEYHTLIEKKCNAEYYGNFYCNDLTENFYEETYNRNAKRAIKKAVNGGVEVLIDTAGDTIDDFVRLYQNTEIKYNTGDYYNFNHADMPTVCSLVVLLGYLTTKDHKKIIIYSALLAIIFGIAGYCFRNPATDPDLVRYLEILSTYKGKGLFESFNTAYTNLYAVDIVFWIIANFGSPQLLPAFACYIYYFIVLYIINDYKAISGIKTSYFLIYFLFTICATNFGSIVNGIRWPLAFSMFFLAIYRDLYKNQRNFFTYFLYISSFFMHFSVIGLIAVRLVMLIKNKKRVLIYSMGIVLLPQMLQIFTEKLGGIQTSIGLLNRIIYFVTRGNMYFQWQDGGWADIVRNSTYYRFEKYYYIVISALFIFMVLHDYRELYKSKFSLNSVKPVYIFLFTYMVLTLVTFLIASHAIMALSKMKVYEKSYDRYIKKNIRKYLVVFLKGRNSMKAKVFAIIAAINPNLASWCFRKIDKMSRLNC